MASCSFSIHKSLLEEVDQINDVDELKHISRTLINENRVLCRKSNAAFKGLENQNELIKYLQDTLDFKMAQHAERARQMYKMLGRESLRTIDSMVRYHEILECLAESNKFKGKDKEKINELLEVMNTVPAECTENGKEKFLNVLAKLEGFQVPKDDVKDDAAAAGDDDEDKGYNLEECIKMFFYPTDDDDDEKDVKEDVKKDDVKETSVQKGNANKSKKKSKYAKPLNMGKTSQTYAENIQSSSVSKKRGLKKKTKAMKKAQLQAEPKSTEKIKGTCNSINEPFDLPEVEIKLIDFMRDISADNDPDIAQFKQKCLNPFKMNVKELEEVKSDNFDKNDKDNLEDELSLQSVASEDNNLEMDSTLSKSTAASHEENTEPIAIIDIADSPISDILVDSSTSDILVDSSTSDILVDSSTSDIFVDSPSSDIFIIPDLDILHMSKKGPSAYKE